MKEINHIGELRFWCQKVLPLVYDDSLSYYELLCKVVAKLNELSDGFNELPDYIRSLITEEYLQPILSDILDELRAQIASINEHDSKTATADRHTGELVWLDGKLYKVTREMLAGDQYFLGSNIEKVNIELLLNRVNSDITEVVTNLTNEINERTEGESLLQENINTEKENRIESDESIRNEIAETKNEILEKINKLNIYNVKDYGAIGDGVNDDTTAIRNTINAIPNEGGVLYFPNGIYAYTDNILLHSNITILCEHTTFKSLSPKILFVQDYGVNNITLIGDIILDANNQTSGVQKYDHRNEVSLFAIGNADNIDWEANFISEANVRVINGVGRGRIYTIHNAKNIIIKGSTTCSTMPILFAIGTSDLELCNVNCKYTVKCSDPVIMDNDVDATGHTFKNVYFHNINIDGNNVLDLSPINVGRSNASGGELNPEGQPFDVIDNVIVDNCTISNILDWGDGIDILESINVKISNCTITTTNCGIVICSTFVTVTNCNITSCRNLGLQLGDPNIGYNWAGITVSNCVFTNNGTTPKQWVYPANFGIAEEDGYNISTVLFSNCVSINIGNTQYGYYQLKNTGGTDIHLSNCLLNGETAGAFFEEGNNGQTTFDSCYPYTPFGILSAPPVALVGSPVVNNFGFPVVVCINNGSTEQALVINGLPVCTLHANETYTFYLAPKMSASVSTDLTGVTWAWYGV